MREWSVPSITGHTHLPLLLTPNYFFDILNPSLTSGMGKEPMNKVLVCEPTRTALRQEYVLNSHC